MEAAFIDIGKGRNAVLYAGEVNWAAVGHKDGQPRKIESVLKSGQTILVQVTKDPVGHKGARLTGQISLPGRFLVYVPDGNTCGICRKLPDTERNRLKTLLKEIVPDDRRRHRPDRRRGCQRGRAAPATSSGSPRAGPTSRRRSRPARRRSCCTASPTSP